MAPKPVELAKPVETGTLREISTESIGLLSAGEGGLGAGMWKGTPRDLIERLLPVLPLPGSSPALNNLADRFLLTTANVPEGAPAPVVIEAAVPGAAQPAAKPSIAALRVDRLIALGDAGDAWKLTVLAKGNLIDEATLRLAAEAALVSDQNKDVCARLPGIIQTRSSPDWQKLLVVCQLQAQDAKSAQLALEVLHAQNVDDTAFFSLAEHNIIAGSKTLPRQLTPLKPLALALLQLTGLPLPSEIYARPDAALVPLLLQTKARDDNARLGLAERAAEHGLIAPALLADAYRNASFTPDALAAPLASRETGARLHALIYQAAVAEKAAPTRLDDVAHLVQGVTASQLSGSFGRILAPLLADIPVEPNYAAYAPLNARVLILAGKPDAALAWFKLARQASESAPELVAQLQDLWPLAALGGVETDSDYGKYFSPWLTAALKDADRAKRERVGQILLILDAAGFAVPEEAWAQVADLPADAKKTAPLPALLLARLHAAATANRAGESVMLSLAAVNAGAEPSLLAVLQAVRALKLAGLAPDALALAREAAAAILMAPPPKT